MIYFLARAKDGAIKIGTSQDVSRRMRELADEQGCECELLATEPGHYKEEWALHERFRRHRLGLDGYSTEWFRPADDLMAYVASLEKTHEKQAKTSPFIHEVDDLDEDEPPPSDLLF